jgi:predicted GH43/DUF377 family glycosyl hydrolase
MKWEKKGLIYRNDGGAWWRAHSVLVPVPYLQSPDRLRLFCGFRDHQGVSRIGYVDVDPLQPARVLGVSPSPVLDIGRPGAFDDNGVVPTCIVREGTDLFLYYFAFQLGVRVRYFLLSGLAISRDGGETFVRHSETPILERSDTELMFRSGPFVRREPDRFRLWYVAGSKWLDAGDAKTLPTYSIHYAESPDGISWPRAGQLALAPAPDEYGVARPVVFKRGTMFHMIFSARSLVRGYCPAYATSPDGKRWDRDDSALGIQRSSDGWDSEMICFHSVFEHGDNLLLFYCGNDFGRAGMGYAVLSEW